MKTIIFIIEIFRKFSFLFILHILLLLIMGLFEACSLITISPVVDFFVHPDLQGISPLTARAIDVLKFFGLSATLSSWLIIFVVFVALTSAFQVFARHSILKMRYAVLRNIILGMFEDFFNAQWYFFSSSKQGVLLNTFARESAVVGEAFNVMALFFSNFLQIIFYLAVPFLLFYKVTVISLGVALFFALPFILLGKLSYKWGTQNTTTSNQLSSVIHENISLAKLVLGFGNQRKSIDNLRNTFDAHRNVTLKSKTLTIATPILYAPFGMLMIAIALFAAHRFNIPLSEIAVLLVALRQASVCIGNMAMQKNSLENFLPSYEQIKTLRQRAKQLEQKSGPRQFKGFSREIEVEGVSFAYPGHKPVLTDINVCIPKGKMIAFVGGSGSGKTTFLDMLLGFYQPITGRILFDGISLEDFDIYSYRRKIGYVPQDTALFNMSIRDNLLWTYESATDEEITEACHQANAYEFIRQLPEGYNTIVGDRGVRLSGGQVQRIALARAILRKPDLLILDEATSSLDTHSERLIQQAIENIAKETTVVVVAHRLSTIVNADYVYVFKEGRIIEQGTYSELINMKGHFNRMVGLQLLEAAK